MRLGYCKRCSQQFPDVQALDTHWHTSPAHWRCRACEIFDGHTHAELLAHHRQSGCPLVCAGCADGAGRPWDLNSAAYWDHVRDGNVCVTCGVHFGSLEDLRLHAVVHPPVSVPAAASSPPSKS